MSVANLDTLNIRDPDDLISKKERIMTLEILKDRLPDYAKDIKLNFSSMLNNTLLTQQQLWGAILVSAIASRNNHLLEAVRLEAKEKLSEAAISAAGAAAAIMAMNNIYYRFTHLAENTEYRQLSAGLRMNILANPGVDKVDFELWSLAVSIINGCGMCIDAHERQLRQHSISTEQIQFVAKVAAIVHSMAVTLEAI